MSYPIGNLNTASRTDSARYSDPEEARRNVELQMENAVEHVVETILNFGVYPQPRSQAFGQFRPQPRTQFDLYDDLLEEKFIEHADLLEFFICAINDQSNFGAFSNLRSSWEKRLNKYLTAKLIDSDMVREKAQEYAEEDQ